MTAEGTVRGPIPVPILMYHSISEEAAPRFRPYAVTPRHFSEHMTALDEGGFTPVTVTGFCDLTRSESPVWPERPVVITFDDAFRDFRETALGALLDHGFPATLYVPTSYVGATSRWLAREGEATRPMLTWSALEEVARAGIEVGSHTQTHPQLDLLPMAAVETQLLESKHELEQRLQSSVTTFAYPFGYWSRPVRQLVEQAGYSSACAVRDLCATSQDDVFTLGRFTVPYGMDADELVARVQAPTGTLARLRSDARARASWLLRRAGVKQRGVTAPSDEDSSERPRPEQGAA
jgi:peptidoglycan/xylan/chitin deacetylase (PgdA/CDA1 family)